MLSAILESIAHFVTSTISSTGYFGVSLLMAIESAMIPLPSEIIMPFSGYLASQGQFNLWALAFFGALGNLIGSLVAYWLGARGGYPLLEKYGKYALISHRDIQRAQKWFERYGPATAFFSRLLPIVRTYISFPAGVARMNIAKFSLFTFLGALPFSYLLAYVGYKMGENWQSLSGLWHKFDYLIASLIIFAAIIWIWRHFKKSAS